MKKRVSVFICSFILICSIVVFGEEVSQDPCIEFDNQVMDMNSDDEYKLILYTKNFSKLKSCEFIIYYNPDVLKCEFASGMPFTDDGTMDFITNFDYSELGKINVKMRLSDNGDIAQPPVDKVRGIIEFIIISYGDLDFSVELISYESVGDCEIEINTDKLLQTITETTFCTDTPVISESVVPTKIAKKGDINEDNTVNAVDALLILKHAARINILHANQISVADLNDDSDVNAFDALEILKIVAMLN